MDPRDFVSLALRLSTSHDEAELRSAVSRAYYGAFHVAQQFLVDAGLRWSRKQSYAAEIHVKTRHCLSQSGNPDAVVAGDQLWSLRDCRNKADYEMASTGFKTSAQVVPQVRVAIEIVNSLERCRIDPTFTETAERMRQYARDVLRIAVIEPER